MNVEDCVKFAIYDKNTKIVKQVGNIDRESFEVMTRNNNDLSPILGDYGRGKKVIAGEYKLGDVISTNSGQVIDRVVSMQDVMIALSSGESAASIKRLVAKTEEVYSKQESVDEWIKNRYYQLRALAYPAITDFIDALVKINSGDDELSAKGAIELQEHVNKCLAIKSDFPKV